MDQYVYFTFSSMDLIGDGSSCSKGNKVANIFFICQRRQSKWPICKRGGHLNTFQCSWTRSRNSVSIHCLFINAREGTLFIIAVWYKYLICLFALCICSRKWVQVAISKGCWCLGDHYYDPTLKLCFGIPVPYSSSWLTGSKLWPADSVLCCGVVYLRPRPQVECGIS